MYCEQTSLHWILIRTIPYFHHLALSRSHMPTMQLCLSPAQHEWTGALPYAISFQHKHHPSSKREETCPLASIP
jgi:hypothetical protein